MSLFIPKAQKGVQQSSFLGSMEADLGGACFYRMSEVNSGSLKGCQVESKPGTIPGMEVQSETTLCPVSSNLGRAGSLTW